MNTDAHEENEEHEETEEERRMRDERFVDKFFTERELIVKFDKTNRSDADAAQAWYEAVEMTISTLPIYRHDRMGQPLNNSEMAETTNNDPNSLTTSANTESNAWFYRGQKDTKFAFTSTLYRRLLNASPHKYLIDHEQEQTPNTQEPPLTIDSCMNEMKMVEAEKRLLNKARDIGIGRGLTALETLTLLQHHGSPTRLIDVTSDWKIALFFACEGDNDVDGRIFLINASLLKWNEFPKEKSRIKRIECLIWQDLWEHTDIHKLQANALFALYWRVSSWPILLPFSDPRMISQRGFFLTGGIPFFTEQEMYPTTRCPRCKRNRCKCSDTEIIPRSTALTRGSAKTLDSHITHNELRKITSLPISFLADKTFLHEVTNEPTPIHRTVGYSIRIPREYKRTLKEILRREGIHSDSIYPPLRETVRLFEHVVDESFKQ